jgi:hypothetical protein
MRWRRQRQFQHQHEHFDNRAGRAYDRCRYGWQRQCKHRLHRAVLERWRDDYELYRILYR